jgi:undecaprenyl-diphosphatase
MKMLDAIVLSVVEGITEFLPVSSTGHMILFQRLLGVEESEAVDAFLVIVQSGAILAVVTVFWPTFMRWLRAWVSLIGLSRSDGRARVIGDRVQSIYFALSVIPFAVVGYFNKDFIKSLFDVRVVAYALLFGGLFILVDEWFLAPRRSGKERSLESFSLVDSLVIGLGQCLALWPGFSRSAATIIFGRWRGFSRTSSAEVSFLIGLPTLCGVAVYEARSSWELISEEMRLQLLVGIGVSWITAFICVKSFLIFLRRFPLSIFAYYRIIVAALLLYFWN